MIYSGSKVQEERVPSLSQSPGTKLQETIVYSGKILWSMCEYKYGFDLMCVFRLTV